VQRKKEEEEMKRNKRRSKPKILWTQMSQGHLQTSLSLEETSLLVSWGWDLSRHQNARKVADLSSFRFDKDLGRIVQQKVKKLPVIGLAPLSVMTETEVVENIRHDPLAIALVGVAFTQASEQNLKNVLQELEEAKERIRTLEEEL
jgi:hypothetical protein